MQKFSEFIADQKRLNEEALKKSIATQYNELYEAKLKEFGVTSPIELNESQTEEFNKYLKTVKESLKAPKPLKESEVKDKKSFREYAEAVLKKAHGDDFDQKIADKVIDGIASEVKDDDWGAAIGKLTSGLGK
jgi:alcohol dehydrogenase class IV